MYFGDYVKDHVSINLFGMWILVDVLLVLAAGMCGDAKSTGDYADRQKNYSF